MATTILEVQAATESLKPTAVSVPPASPLTAWLSEFEEKIAADFRRRTKLDFKETVQQIVEAAELMPGLRVLDAATGTGILARQFVGRVGELGHIIGVDNAARIEQARLAALSAKVSRKLEWHEAPPEKLPFENASFELVTCAMAFHRLPAVEFLAAAYRVLKPGGRLIIADELAPVTPSPLRAWFRRSYYRYIARDNVEANARFYQAEELTQLLCAAGFRQQTIKVLRERGKHDWAFALVKAIK
jgi:ubiquinone/menaquinone biosynthesis C-methylase UbiE